ncbi:unnamed protein product [Trifolium pratense]|uniref:Uncharacterized protein n=1 Tax=Trifolium pratense TaxID=57577 RepID=A0ACB0JFE2_TRIPR|nr:unnamed protein product [Trifolium pratense]
MYLFIVNCFLFIFYNKVFTSSLLLCRNSIFSFKLNSLHLIHLECTSLNWIAHMLIFNFSIYPLLCSPLSPCNHVWQSSGQSPLFPAPALTAVYCFVLRHRCPPPTCSAHFLRVANCCCCYWPPCILPLRCRSRCVQVVVVVDWSA